MKTILLIDDDELVRLVLRDTLVLMGGYEVLVASDGRAARKQLAQRAVDLVITDIIMPDEEGVETILLLRKKFPDIPIIAISGGARIKAEDCLKIAQAVGADITLAKPFTSKELLDAVERIGLERNSTCCHSAQ